MVNIKSPNSNSGNGAGLSGKTLQGFPHGEIAMGIVPGTYCFDDFDKFESMAASGAQNGYYVLLDGSAALDLTNEVGGVIELDLSADDEDALIITGEGTAGFCQIASDVSAREDLFFEARVKPIDESNIEFFVGLTTPQQTTVIAATDDTLVDVTLIGFHGKSDGTIDVVLNDPAGATTTTTTTATQTDDTWMKLAIRFSTNDAGSGRLEFMIDGDVVVKYSDLTNSVNGISTSVDQDVALCGTINVTASGAATEFEIDHLAYGYEGCNE
jgi:hypothetical protein